MKYASYAALIADLRNFRTDTNNMNDKWQKRGITKPFTYIIHVSFNESVMCICSVGLANTFISKSQRVCLCCDSNPFENAIQTENNSYGRKVMNWPAKLGPSL